MKKGLYENVPKQAFTKGRRNARGGMMKVGLIREGTL